MAKNKEFVMTNSFGATSTTDDVLAGIDLKGKRALVTGVSAGLGVETARALAAHGAEVVGAARDLKKAKRATGEVGDALELVELDLASLKSVRACAEALLADGRPFDVVTGGSVIPPPAAPRARPRLRPSPPLPLLSPSRARRE